MVDWENTATVAVPAYDILRVLILQRRDAFIEALEAYHRAKNQGMAARTYEVRARLNSLYEELFAAFTNGKTETEVKEFEEMLKADDLKTLIAAWRTINSWLYDKKLIQFDTRLQYDSTRAEQENDLKGMR